MVKTPTNLDTAAAAKTAMDEAAREVKLQHGFNYLSNRSRPKSFSEHKTFNGKNSQNRIIYNAPGRARTVELVLKDSDLRAGAYPQHNSVGCFSQNIEQLVSANFGDFSGMLMPFDLEQRGFVKTKVAITRKRIYQIAKQFSHMSLEAFKQMICIYDDKQRDYDVYVRKIEGDIFSKTDSQTVVAVFNPTLNFLQFVQVLQKDFAGNVTNLKHIVFEAGEPIVINESRLDQYGKLRQIAHVGDWDRTVAV